MAQTRRRRVNRSRRQGLPGLFWAVILAVAFTIAVLMVSCSNPPQSSQPTKRSVASARHEGPREERRSEEPQKAEDQAQAPAEHEKPRVTTTEVPPTEENAAHEKTIGAPTEQLPAEPHPAHHVRRQAGLPGEIIHVSNTNEIALTFDAGASPAPTPSILRTLKAAGLHVTFFLTGKWCQQNPDLVRQIAAEGHEIGNHTYSHPDLRKIGDYAIEQQLKETDDIISHLTGRSTKPYFRPPFGGRDKRVLSVAAGEGYTSVYWSLDSWDAFKKGITSEEIQSRVLDRIQGGDIVLMHCGSQPTADALPGLIDELQKRGYHIVRISELVGGA